VTVAFATTAPEESVITPVNVAKIACDHIAVVKTSIATNAIATRLTFFNMKPLLS
jgi:hypothetical protein